MFFKMTVSVHVALCVINPMVCFVCDRSENTWEPEENLECQELIDEFLAKQKKEEEKKKSKTKAKSADEPKKKKQKTSSEVSCDHVTHVGLIVTSQERVLTLLATI